MPAIPSTKPPLWTDPEWETVSAARFNINPAEGVRRSIFLTNRWYQLAGMRKDIQVDVYTIIRKLNEKRIPFVLTGAYGIASWTGRPRATHDIDILVKGGRNFSRAVNAIKAAYPNLEVRPFFGVQAFFAAGDSDSIIVVIYPHRKDLEETLESAVWVEERGLRYRIPSLEAALANKYGAMLNPNRDIGKRLLDVADFTFMVRHSLDPGRQPVEKDKLIALGEKVWPGGGGSEILRLFEYATTGRGLSLDELIRRTSS